MVRTVARARRIAQPSRAQVAGGERQVRCLLGDIGTGPDRHAEVRLGQRGSVVESVANHRDGAAGALQAGNRVDLAVRSDIRQDLVDPDLCGDGARRYGQRSTARRGRRSVDQDRLDR